CRATTISSEMLRGTITSTAARTRRCSPGCVVVNRTSKIEPVSSLYAKYVRDRPAYLSNASTTYPALAGGAGRSARTSRQQVAVPNTRNRPFTREISEQTGWILLLVTFRTHSQIGRAHV